MQGLLYLVLAVYLFVLPGYALVGLWTRAHTAGVIAERVGIAIALSVALYPLLFLAAWMAGVRAGVWVAWGPGALGMLALAWSLWRSRPRAASVVRSESAATQPLRFPWAAVSLVAIVALIGWTRRQAALDMVAPAWGDSVHHVMIVQLMLEQGGLFQDWSPYAPLETFTYHAGLHANLTVWAAATGLPADQAVLWGGQLFNVFAVLTLFPLAYRLSGGNLWVGMLALAAAGLLSTMPGYYTNWGRYTQLGAQVILPALVWGFDRLWCEAQPQSSRTAAWVAGLIAVLAAGLVLTHYRVAMVGGAAGAAWALWALWRLRADWRSWAQRTAWVGAAAAVAALLAAPWLLRLGQGHLTTVAASISAPADSQTATDELVMWTTVSQYYPLWLFVLIGLAGVFAVWRAPRLGIPLALWAGLAFLAANPALIGVRGSGLVSNFLLMIGLYVVFAAPAGWFLWWVGQWLVRRAAYIQAGAGPAVAGLLLVSAAVTAIGSAGQQARVVDPVHELVFDEDLAVMDWIDEHVAPDAAFLAHSFLAFSDMAVVGSDAGWWLPYYTRRAVNVLPITYTMETVAADVDKEGMRQLVLGVRATEGDRTALRALLCRAGITHLYQGQRQGTFAAPHERLFQEAWLADNPDFALLQRAGHAAVWEFARVHCG